MTTVKLNLNLTLDEKKATELIKLFHSLGAEEETETYEGFTPLEQITEELYPELSYQEVIGQQLHTLRKREHMTQIELAEKVGTIKQNISAMEKGKRPIGKTIAKKLALIFNVDYRIFL